MKAINKILTIVFVASIFSCEGPLEEEVFSELPPDYLTTESGLNTVLTAAYASTQYKLLRFPAHLQTNLFMSGEGWGQGGSWEGAVTGFFTNYTWNTTSFTFNGHWREAYDAILFTNIVFENIENENFSEEFVRITKGEALAIRGYNYYQLFDYFGPTVIHLTSTPEELNKSRSSEEEMLQRIEADLLDAIELLDREPKNGEYGRFTKGAAMGVLCKFYLNTKQWQKCAEMAQQIMSLGIYNLVPDYNDVFSIANEGNEEILWVHPADATPQRVSNNLFALTLPGNYALTYPNQASFAARVYFRDSLIDSFEEGDERVSFFVKEWTTRQGNTVVGYGRDQSLCLKYGEDPNANGGEAGNDFPEIRYADILLSRAEALNEITGPNAESISLINDVRLRAGASRIFLEDFSSREALRDHILDERGWEFYYEEKRRQDLIRHGKLIPNARDRGISAAQPYHILYPIPQSEMDANPNMVQNEGY